MANRFTVNNVTYTAKPFNFDLVCELEEMGVSFTNIDKVPMSLIRSYFAICADVSKEQASALIEKHLIDGGSLDSIITPISKEMNDSDFFRALSERENETSTQGRKKKETIEE